MKRIVIILILINLAVVSKAQQAELAFGIQSGLNVSASVGSGIPSNHRAPLLGLHIGAHLKISQNERWGYKILLTYDRLGWKNTSLLLENSTGTGLVDADLLFKSDYLNLPVLAEYSFGRKIKINIDAGPFVGFLLNHKVVTQLQQPASPAEPDMETSPANRKAVNFGLSLGSGVQIPITSKLNIQFNIRDNFGLSNVYKQKFGGNNTRINTLNFASGLTVKI